MPTLPPITVVLNPHHSVPGSLLTGGAFNDMTVNRAVAGPDGFTRCTVVAVVHDDGRTAYDMTLVGVAGLNSMTVAFRFPTRRAVPGRADAVEDAGGGEDGQGGEGEECEGVEREKGRALPGLTVSTQFPTLTGSKISPPEKQP